jgi:hypothetical protein
MFISFALNSTVGNHSIKYFPSFLRPSYRQDCLENHEKFLEASFIFNKVIDFKKEFELLLPSIMNVFKKIQQSRIF